MTERARSGIATEAGSAKAVLFELQVEQHHHDEVYHREIARLSLHQRLNHMALHFAKYAGRVAAAENISDTTAIYTDVLIIGLSTANILNENAWTLIGQEQEYPGLLTFARSLSSEVAALGDINELIRETSKAAGRVAAACEKIDHLEGISFRGEIKGGLAKLLILSLAVIASQGIDPAAAIRMRLQSVKSRLTLHGRI